MESANGVFDVKASDEVMALFGELRLGAQLSEALSFTAKWDFGGLGGGEHQSSRAAAMLQIRFDEHFGVEIGYQVLGVEYDQLKGRDAFRVRAVTHGPVFSLTVHW